MDYFALVTNKKMNIKLSLINLGMEHMLHGTWRRLNGKAHGILSKTCAPWIGLDDKNGGVYVHSTYLRKP